MKNCWRKSTLIFGEDEASQKGGDGAATQEGGEGSTASDEEEDDGEDEEAEKIIAMVANFATANSQTAHGSYHSEPRNDFDEVLDEMTRTVGGLANGNAYEAMEEMLDGWVSMENNEYCRQVLGEEAQQLMTVDALCGLAMETT